MLELGSYHRPFIVAMEGKHYEQAMIDLTDQQALSDIFNRHINNKTENRTEIHISDKHYEQIIAQFGLTGADNKMQAQTLFSLAAVFARYSSSYLFGTESDSPLAVRNYAYALLHKAKNRDKTIIADSDFEQWKNQFLGLDGAFTCTALLSDGMISVARDQFPDIINSLLPPAWN